MTAPPINSGVLWSQSGLDDIGSVISIPSGGVLGSGAMPISLSAPIGAPPTGAGASPPPAALIVPRSISLGSLTPNILSSLLEVFDASKSGSCITLNEICGVTSPIGGAPG